MSAASAESLTIVVALTSPAPPAFAERLARLSEEAGPHGEVFVVDASGKLSVEWLARRFPNVRVFYRPIGQLTPQLWRDGLIRSEAHFVAFTSAPMLVAPGWRAALIERLNETNAAGVGGPIEPGRRLSMTDSAVVLLRYSRYFPPIKDTDLPEPPGDNVLYRRDRLREVERIWTEGFWEFEVNQALRNRGETLALAGSAIATFKGGAGLFATAFQRARHGKRYGVARSREMSNLGRFARVVGSPLVPPLLCLRIFLTSRGQRFRLIFCLPVLLLLATAWAFGEAVGTWAGPSNLPDVKP